jgi:hypothetical protein
MNFKRKVCSLAKRAILQQSNFERCFDVELSIVNLVRVHVAGLEVKNDQAMLLRGQYRIDGRTAAINQDNWLSKIESAI